MQKQITQFVLRKPKLIFFMLLLLTAVTAALIPMIQIDTDPENMLSEDQVSRQFHNQVKARFNLHDMIVVGAVSEHEQGIYNQSSLTALHAITEQVIQIAGVIDYDLMALSTVDNISQVNDEQLSGGGIRFEWLMKEPPANDEQAAELAAKVARLPLLQNTLVSADQKAASIYVPIADKNESHRIATTIQSIIDDTASDDEYHITGLPVAEDTFGYQMFIQMGISAPLAGLMIFVMLWYFFRNFKFIAAPMIVAMVTVITVMGTMIGMGYTVHIMSSMIAIFLMPIAVVDSVHIMSDFVERYHDDEDRAGVIGRVVGDLFKPMLFTSVTSAIGFFSLMLTPIPPVQIFGAFVGGGILLAFILTILFIPAYLIVLKPSSLAGLKQLHHSESALSALIKKLGGLGLAHSKSVLFFFLLTLAISVWGIMKIQINDNPVRWFKADHPIRVADQVLNAHFAGTYDAYLVLEADVQAIEQDFKAVLEAEFVSMPWFEQAKSTYSEANGGLAERLNELLFWAEDQLFAVDADEAAGLDQLITVIEQTVSDINVFKSPPQLAYVAALQQGLQNSGWVGKSNSLADLVKTVNRELQGGEQAAYQLPQSQSGVAQTLLQYQSSHRPQDLWHFVSQDYTSTVIWIHLTSGDNQDMSRVVDYMQAFTDKNPPPENISVQWAGKAYLNKVWQEQMVAGMGMSLISAFVVVFVMMVVLFRSLLFGLLAMLPLTLTISFIYGLIGWVGKNYDMPIAVLSALTLGLSVDFAIHFLQRARDIHATTKNFQATMVQMFEEPAAAISKNAMVIAIGFTPLLLAPLVPYITVGVFLAGIMAVSALVTLVMLPAVLNLLKTWAFRSES